MIKYCLVENFLTNGNNKFMAIVSNPESKNFKATSSTFAPRQVYASKTLPVLADSNEPL